MPTTPPTRILTLLAVLGLAAPAAAETALVVLGPVAATSTVPAATVASVKAALDRSGFAPAGTTPDAQCVLDTRCLAKTGAAAGATQVMGVSIRVASKTTVTVDVVLVDVVGNELIARRDVTGKAEALGATLQRFVDESPVVRAKALFAEGNQHYSLGEYAQALELYKRAYRVKALSAFLFNVAQCHRKLDQHREAIAMYQSYLVGVPDAANKPLVESLITESKGKLAEEQRAAEARDANAANVTAAEAQRKAAEAQRKAAEADARAERERAEQARIAAERGRETTYNKHPARRWMLLTGAVGVAAGGVGGYFAYRARGAQDAFDKVGCGDPTRSLGADALAQCIDDRDRGTRDALFGNIFIGSAAAIVVTSALVYALDPGNLERPAATRQARVGFTGSSVQVVVQW